jgi:hypothetical protein
VHNETGPHAPDPDTRFAHLFGLATAAKHLRKKLISELGLILQRDPLLFNETDAASGHTDADAANKNGAGHFEVDRRVFTFLKHARLEQLARAEHELAKVGLATPTESAVAIAAAAAASKPKLGSKPAQPVPSAPEQPTVTRLVDVILEPNLDDKLLFPYFSYLIKTNQSLGSAPEMAGWRHRRSQHDGFWPWLAASLDEHRSDAATTNSTHDGEPTTTLKFVQIKADYCRYVQRLYGLLFADQPDVREPDRAAWLAGELKRADPYRLVAHVADQQLRLLASGSDANAQLAATNNNNQAETPRPQVQPQPPPPGFKWRRNGTANALDFYHLRQAHLLQQLLIQMTRTTDPNDAKSSASQGGFEEPARLVAAGDDETDDDDDEGDQLITRLQRQQQRSMMLMLQQQQEQLQQSSQDLAAASAGSLTRHTKRELADGQATVLAQQVAELLADFDLLVIVVPPADPSARGRREPSPALPGLLDAVSQQALRGATLSRPLVSYLEMADLHHLCVVRGTPAYLNGLCELGGGNRTKESPPLAANYRQQVWRPAGWEPARSGFVLVASKQPTAIRQQQLQQQQPAAPKQRLQNETKSGRTAAAQLQSGYLLDNELLIDRIAEFASSGRLTARGRRGRAQMDTAAGHLKPYNTLDRRLEWAERKLDDGSTTSSVLDDDDVDEHSKLVIDNLISARLDLVPYLGRLLDWTSTPRRHDEAARDHEHALDGQPAMLLPPADLASCLLELNSILAAGKKAPTAASTSAGDPHIYENSTLARAIEESTCLLKAANKLRGRLRAGASDELDPLVSQFIHLVMLSNNHQHRRQQQQQQPLIMANKSDSDAGQQKQQQRISPMTTRNTVNQSESLYLDQLSSSSSSSSVVEPIGHHLERELADGATNDERRHGLIASSGGGALPAATSSADGIRGFFAKTYKDAVGQALGIVVGTGLLIFLLNLVIVLVIAFRSRRNLRRTGRVAGQQSVQDSAAANHSMSGNGPAGGGGDDGQREPLKSLDISGLAGAAGQAQVYGQLLQPLSGGALGDSMLDAGQQSDSQATRLLISSFRNNNNSSNNHHQQGMHTNRSSLSSNSQRANKSIKFDLSGETADKGQARLGPGQSQRGIMKQPVATSDEDELHEMTETLANENCAHHQPTIQQNYHTNHHQIVGEQINQYAHAVAPSPPSLDVLKLVPFNGFAGGAGYDALNLVTRPAAGYVTTEDRFIESSATMGKCQLHCHEDYHLNHQHQPRQQQQQQPQQQHNHPHHHQQSLGSSSLTSPFASQSTHSTISASNNNHLHNLARPDFSPKPEQMQYGQPHTFYAGFGPLNSPTSSTTLSNVPTPVLPTQQELEIEGLIVLSAQDQLMLERQQLWRHQQ